MKLKSEHFPLCITLLSLILLTLIIPHYTSSSCLCGARRDKRSDVESERISQYDVVLDNLERLSEVVLGLSIAKDLRGAGCM